MKTKLIRIIAFFVMSVFVLSAFSGCQTNNGATNTQGNTTAESQDATPQEPLTLDGYQIVIPDQAKDKSVESLVAYELRAILMDLGASLRVTEDDGNTTFDTPVILLGKTAATTEEMPEGNDYSIKETNGTIQISAENYYGYTAALGIFKTMLKRNGGIPRGTHQTGSANVSSVKRASDDSIRVLYYNVLYADHWFTPDNQQVSGAKAPTLAIRQDLQRDFLTAYAPDVLCFQEYNVNTFHVNVDAKLQEMGYTEVLGDGVVETPYPIFYKADQFTLVECGQFAYSNQSLSSGKGKGYTWAVLKENATNKQFAVFSTHFISNGTESGRVWDVEREANVRELLTAVKAVTDKYEGIAVIAGGDFNFWNVWPTYGTETSRKPYRAMLNGGMTLASNISGVKTNAYTTVNSYHGYYRFDASKKIYDMMQSTLTHANEAPYTLDHIFIGNKQSVTVKSHLIIEDDITKRASDHSPLFVDLVLK